MNPPTSQSSTGSREKIKCQYCESVMERRNLKGHTTRVHAGLSPAEKPSNKQSTISFPASTVKRHQAGDNNNDEIKKTKLDENIASGSETIDMTERDKETDHVSNEDIMKEVLKTQELVKRAMTKADEEQDMTKPKDTHDNDLGYLLQKVRSIEEIANLYSELKFVNEKNVILCELCFDIEKIDNIKDNEKEFGVIRTNGVEEPKTDNDPLPRSFLNLKNIVKQHVGTYKHKEQIQNLKQRNVSSKKGPENRNNNEAAMRCARICHELYKMGRPYTDYPEMVALFVKNGVFMGDTNHSTEFPARFLKNVASVVRDKMSNVLKIKLKQTGHVRPCKIIADKDTSKHRTRQLICLTTVFPGAEDLIQTVFIDHPLIRHHKTQDVAENIVTFVKKFLTNESYAGGSYDGAYFHAKKDVPQHINEAFNVDDSDVHNDHDAMHRTGLGEKRARKKGRNDWVNNLGKSLATAFKDHNYGKKYEELREIAELMGIELLDPKFHSETRFANSCSNVFKAAYRDLPALIENYKKVVDENLDSNLQEERDKAKHAADMLKKLNNKKAILKLAATCDIYAQFSQMVCELQKVNLLPIQRYSEYQRIFNKMRRMRDSLNDHSTCEPNNCHWTKLHKDMKDILDGKFGSIKVASNEGEPGGRILRSFLKRNSTVVEVPLMKKVEKEVQDFIDDLLDELKDVFRAEDIQMIENTRPLTDWTNHALKIRERSVPVVHALEKSKFVNSCKKVCRSLKEIDSIELESQFYTFLKRLEVATKHENDQNLEKTDPKDLIHNFSSLPGLYEGIELVMRATYEACVKISVESVAESVISVYNQHNSKIRNIGEENANNEFFIAYNGPEIGEADEVLRDALDLHFSKSRLGWHFTTNTLFHSVGPTVDKILKTKNKLNIY